MLKEKFHKVHFKYSYVWIVIVLRLLAAFYIYFNPLRGFIWTMLIDWWDCYFFKHRARMSWQEYHELDKYLDWVSYLVMLVTSVRYGSFVILFALLLFRLIGQALFLKKKKTIYFLLFPNMFEMAFLWFVILKGLFNVSGSDWIWLIILFVVKELQEIYLHYLWPRYLKTKGYPKWLQRLGYEDHYIWKKDA